jgi:hypothetical protein
MLDQSGEPAQMDNPVDNLRIVFGIRRCIVSLEKSGIIIDP